MKPHETIEQHERLAEGSEGGSMVKFPIPAPVLVAVLAALLAIVALLGEYSQTHTIIYQGEANEAWAKYSSAVFQQHLDGDIALILRGIARGDPRHTELLAEASRLDAQISSVHAVNQQRFQEEAIHLESQRNDSEMKHHTFQYAQGGLEVAVIIGSVGVMVGAAPLLWSSAGLGILSLLMMVDGLVAASGAECCLMHMLGEPRTMQAEARYDDVVSEVKAFLEERLRFAVAEGVDERGIMLDPGIGCGKSAEHNLEPSQQLEVVLGALAEADPGVEHDPPLVDALGRVAGVSTSGLSRNMTLAIPSSTVNRVVEQLLTKGRIARGYLGVGMQPVRVPDNLKSSLGLSADGGLIVVSVEEGGPADQAGLFVGDIIVALDGSPVQDTDDVQRLLDPDRVGKPLAARVIRGGQIAELSITVGERPRRG